jgi:hypothetical protein
MATLDEILERDEIESNFGAFTSMSRQYLSGTTKPDILIPTMQ